MDPNAVPLPVGAELMHRYMLINNDPTSEPQEDEKFNEEYMALFQTVEAQTRIFQITAFKIYDSNRDGYLPWDDLPKLLRAVGYNPNETMCHEAKNCIYRLMAMNALKDEGYDKAKADKEPYRCPHPVILPEELLEAEDVKESKEVRQAKASKMVGFHQKAFLAFCLNHADDLMKVKADDEQTFLMAFREFDTTGAGKFSIADFRYILQECGDKLTDEEADAFIDVATKLDHGNVVVDGFVIYDKLVKTLRKTYDVKNFVD